jgi:uncharacterized protein (TIGR02145 family)
VKFSDHHIKFDQIPIDAPWTMSVEGLHKAVDNRHVAVWWSGTNSGTATAGPDSVHWITTKVQTGDTTTPVFLDATGIPPVADSLKFNTTTVSISFTVADTDTVYLNDTLQKAVPNSRGSYSFTRQVTSPQRIELVTPSGNVSITTLAYKVSNDPKSDTTTPTIKFLSPSTDTPLNVSPSTFPVKVEPWATTKIDSVVIKGHKLTGQPWSWDVPVSAGLNTISATVYAANGRSATAKINITLPKKTGGDTTPPAVSRKLPVSKSVVLPWRDSTIKLSWIITVGSGSPTVSVNGTTIAVPADSIWATTQPLAVGLDTIALLANNEGGYSTYDTVFVQRLRDIVPPAIHPTGTPDMPLAFGTRSTTLSWIVTDSSGVASVKAGDFLLTATNDSTYTLQVNLPKRSLGVDTMIVVVATDRARNPKKDSIRVQVAGDTSHPVIQRDINTHDLVMTRGTSQLLKWTVTDLDTVVKVTVNGKQIYSLDAIYADNLTLDRDTLPVVLIAIDAAGDTAKDSLTLTALKTDTGAKTPPSLVARNPAVGIRIDTVAWGEKNIDLSWTINVAKGTPTVSVNKSALPLSALTGSTWSLQQSLKVGLDTFALMATDTSGNSLYDTIFVYRRADTTKPVVTRNVGTTDTLLYGAPNYHVSWTVTDSDKVDSVTLSVNSGSVTTLTPSKPDTYSTVITFNTNDTNVFLKLVAKDAAGNHTTDTLHLRRVPDSSTALKNLSVNFGTLTPATFDISINDYVDTLPNETSPTQPTLTVTPTAYESVTFSDSSNLTTNVVVNATRTLVVTNKYTNQKRTYTVKFHRIATIPQIPWKTGITYDTFSDTRDKKSYRAVKIGTQTWMAENLRYAGDSGTTVGACYNDSAENCTKYGRLYTWSEAMAGSTTSSNTSPSGVQGICPSGWHLPSDAEWTTLENNLSSDSSSKGTLLKSLSGWADDSGHSGNGTDVYGFRVLPASKKSWSSSSGEPDFGIGQYAYFWSTTQDGSGNSYSRTFRNSFTYIYRSTMAPAAYSLSVRCLQ